MYCPYIPLQSIRSNPKNDFILSEVQLRMLRRCSTYESI